MEHPHMLLTLCLPILAASFELRSLDLASSSTAAEKKADSRLADQIQGQLKLGS